MAAVPQRQAGFAMMLTGVSSLDLPKFAPSVPFSAHREIATPNAVCAAEIGAAWSKRSGGEHFCEPSDDPRRTRPLLQHEATGAIAPIAVLVPPDGDDEV